MIATREGVAVVANKKLESEAAGKVRRLQCVLRGGEGCRGEAKVSRVRVRH